MNQEDFTLAFWYKGDTNENAVILSTQENKDTSYGYTIYTKGHTIGFSSVSALGKGTCERDVFDATYWRYVTVVVEQHRQLVTLYIDGCNLAAATINKGSLDSELPLRIGADVGGYDGSNACEIAHVQTWNRALTREEIVACYKQYDMSDVDFSKLQGVMNQAKRMVEGGLIKRRIQADYDRLKNTYAYATAMIADRESTSYTQQTIDYYVRELNNALFIWEKSDKTKTPADLNVTAIGDPEMSASDETKGRIESDFRIMMQVFPQSDMIWIAGDSVGGNNSGEGAWMQYMTEIIQRLTQEGVFEHTLIRMVRGNHDMTATSDGKLGAQYYVIPSTCGGISDTPGEANLFAGDEAYTTTLRGHITGNPYYFIGFNCNSMAASDDVKNKLDAIKSAPDYKPTTPIFVSAHYGITGTTAGGVWAGDATNNVNRYIHELPNVFYMYGHTHYDPTDIRCVYQNDNGCTYMDLGATSYSSYIDDGPDGGYIEGCYIDYKVPPRIANFFELYHEPDGTTRMIIKQYNLSTETYVGIPYVVQIGDADQVVYNWRDIDNPRELIAPEFTKEIVLNAVQSDTVDFTFIQA
ncbi:MAG: LamG-like jellyroll fold domain-containing protein, partial [Cellulosilyticaceae bacterium]